MTSTAFEVRPVPPTEAPAPEAPSAGRIDTALGIAVAAAMLLPFFALAAYAHPQNDDWAFAAWTLRRGFEGANAFWYQAWTGRYTATAVLSGSPIALGSLEAFGALIAAHLAIFVAGAVAAALALVPPAVGTGRRVALGLLFSALHFALMPSTSEGLYWLAGTSTYLLPSALILLLAGVLGALERSTGWRRLALAAAGAALAFAAAGANEVSVLVLDALTVGWLVRRTWRDRTFRWDFAVVAAAAALGTAVAVLAPGTSARLASSPGIGVGAAVALALPQCGRLVAAWTLAGPLVPALVLAAPTLATAARVGRWRLPNPALAALAWLGATFCAYLVPALATGVVERRATNVVHWVFLVGAFATVASAAAWLERRLGRAPSLSPRAAATVAAVALGLCAAFPTSHRLATADLVSGRARRWHAAMTDRVALIQACRATICAVPRISNPPASLVWFEDAVDEAGDTEWFKNYKGAYAFCFGKRRIRLEPPAAPP